MKVLILSQYFFPENFPINHVARLLSKNNFKVDILTGKPNYPNGEYFKGYRFFGNMHEIYNSNISIYRVPLFKRNKNSSALSIALNYFSFIFFAITNGPWLLKKNEYDFIFVCCYSPLIQAIAGIFLSWYRKIPLYIWVQDLWPESISSTGFIKNRIFLKVIRIIVKRIYKSSNKIFTQSISMRDHIINEFKLDPGKVSFLPNALDSELIGLNNQDNSAPKEITPYLSKFNILFAGNVGKAQSFSTILKTAELLKDYEDINFIILGTGSEFEHTLREIKNKRLNNIHLFGQVNHKEVHKYIYNSDALLISLKDSEIFSKTIPSKLQFYLASNKLIIGSINGEAAEIIKQSNCGFVSKAEDSEKLAENCINASRMSSQERLKLGENGVNYFNTFFSDVVFLNTFKKLVISSNNK